MHADIGIHTIMRTKINVSSPFSPSRRDASIRQSSPAGSQWRADSSHAKKIELSLLFLLSSPFFLLPLPLLRFCFKLLSQKPHPPGLGFNTLLLSVCGLLLQPPTLKPPLLLVSSAPGASNRKPILQSYCRSLDMNPVIATASCNLYKTLPSDTSWSRIRAVLGSVLIPMLPLQNLLPSILLKVLTVLDLSAPLPNKIFGNPCLVPDPDLSSHSLHALSSSSFLRRSASAWPHVSGSHARQLPGRVAKSRHNFNKMLRAVPASTTNSTNNLLSIPQCTVVQQALSWGHL